MMAPLVGAVVAILVAGLLLKRAGQPQLLGYLGVGIALGPSGFALIDDQTVAARIGEVGVVLLLFFAGMEVSLPKLLSRWRLPVLGTLLQVAASVACAYGIGLYFGWSLQRSVLLGFVISLSSTAVVLKLLRDRGELEAPIGRDVVGVLLTQDLILIPMLIVVGVLGGEELDTKTVAIQILAGILVTAFLVVLAHRDEVHLPLRRWLQQDKELQVFGAFLVCFGMALITGLVGLSAALGAFLGGILVGAARETHWVDEALYPFQVLFLAVFFVSIGMMLDLSFIAERLPLVLALLAAVLFTNTFINALIFRLHGRTPGNSLYGGALLSQVGEFSFVVAAVGLQVGLLDRLSYQLVAAVITLSLFVSPAWIALMNRIRRRVTPHDPEEPPAPGSTLAPSP